jgi:type II secretory pathway predicted ATPase ExeA
MYLDYFGLTEPPFTLTPNTDFFFAGGGRGEVLRALIYAVTHGEGLVKVVGEVGSGKTMLLRMLQENLPATVESIYIPHPSLRPREMLHAIARESGLRLADGGDRLLAMNALQSHLIERHEQGRRVVVLLEEAQAIPPETLEEVRLLTNLETRREKLLQIVLFGQPELDGILARPEMRQFRERISHSFSLAPLKPIDIRAYLNHRMEKAGYRGPPLFSSAVLKALAGSSKGIVRRLNILADKTLLAAFAERTRTIRPRHVRQAARDSGHKPPTFPFAWLSAGAGVLALTGGAWLIHSGSAEDRAPPKRVPAAAADGTATPSPSPAGHPGERTEKPAAETRLLAGRPAATRLWLDSAPPHTASIQLMTAASEADAEAFLHLAGYEPALGPVYLYSMTIDGKPRSILLLGEYPGRAEAMRVLPGLPAPLTRHHPLVRTVGGIKKDLEKPDNG